MIDYVFFNERLIFTFIGRSRIILAALVLVIVTLLIETIYCCVNRSNKGISVWTFLTRKPLFSQRLTLRQQITRDIVVSVILCAILISSAFPIYSDIKQLGYVEVEAQYTRNERSSEGNLLSYGHVYVETNGEMLSLELPRGWTNEEFPLGTYYGTVWYSKRTKVILAFVPQ